MKATPAPAEGFARVFAAELIGIQHGERGGHAFLPGKMVVGNDEVDAQPFGRLGGGEGADPGIDADDQAHARGGGALDHVVLHAVAFADAVRDVEVGGSTTEVDGRLQDDDCGGAVDIVVAVNEDAFLALDGGVQTVDSGAHAGHRIGRVQLRE